MATSQFIAGTLVEVPLVLNLSFPVDQIIQYQRNIDDMWFPARILRQSEKKYGALFTLFCIFMNT